MKPVIVNFIPFPERSIVDIRFKRDSDLAAGLTAYRVKKVKKETTKKPRKSTKIEISTAAQANLDKLDPVTRQLMMEALSGKR